MKHASRLHARRLAEDVFNEGVARVSDYLEVAGSRRPDDLGVYAVTSGGAGGSSVSGQTLRELFRGDVAMSHQRASEDFARIQIGTFCKAANADSRNDLKKDLKAHPPDRRRIWVIADPHFRDYWPLKIAGPQEDGSMIVHSDLARAAHCVYNPKSNTDAPFADPFLCIAVAWHSGGRQFVRLVHIEYLMGLAASDSMAHAKIIHAVIQDLGVKVSGVIVDSWYDDAGLRAWFRSQGLKLLHRLRFGPQGTRYIWINDVRTTLQDLAKDLADDPSVKAKPIRRWGPQGQETDFDVKRAFYVGVMGEEDPAKRHPDLAHRETVELQIAMKPGKAGPEIDWDRTSAVILNAEARRAAGFLYYLRWTIESHFQVVVESEAVTRERLASRVVVNFVALATLVRLAIAMRDTLVDHYPKKRLGGVSVRRLAVRTIIHAALIAELAR